MTLHTLLALIAWLHVRLAEENPGVPHEVCWPTRPILLNAINENRRFFPSGTTAISTFERLLEGRDWLERGPCSAADRLHPCEHWRLTPAGRAALARLDRDKCGRGTQKGRCPHRSLAQGFIREAA